MQGSPRDGTATCYLSCFSLQAESEERAKGEQFSHSMSEVALVTLSRESDVEEDRPVISI